MNFLLYLVIVGLIFTVAMGLLGHNIKLILPVLIGLLIVVAVVRALLIKRKNSY